MKCYLLAILIPSVCGIFLATVTTIILTFFGVVDIIAIAVVNPSVITIAWCFSWSVSRSLGSWSWRWGRWASTSTFLKNQNRKKLCTIIFLMAFSLLYYIGRMSFRLLEKWINLSSFRFLGNRYCKIESRNMTCLLTCLAYNLSPNTLFTIYNYVFMLAIFR